MPLPYALPTWIDADYTVATPVSLPVFSSPIPGDNSKYLLTQKFQQCLFDYEAAHDDLNKPHADYPDYVLVEEGELMEIGGGFVEWTRKYAKKPNSLDDWGTHTYNFIGLSGSTQSGVVIPNRPRISRTVISKLVYDYFIVPSTGITDPITGDVYNIAVPGDIQKIYAMQYCSQYTFPAGGVIGGIAYAVNSLNPAAASSATYPTLEDYFNTMLPNSYASGWNGIVTLLKIFNDYTFNSGTSTGHFAGAIDVAHSTLGGIIAAEDSNLTRWMGQIYQRATRFVLAQ
jgi:hypothetical protein